MCALIMGLVRGWAAGCLSWALGHMELADKGLVARASELQPHKHKLGAGSEEGPRCRFPAQGSRPCGGGG